MKVEARSLTLTGIRHAFFTRAGGVSGATGSKVLLQVGGI